MFTPSTLYYSDGYKTGHKRMLAAGTDFLYGTWIPRSLKHAHKSIEKIVSIGQQLSVMWLNDEFNQNFFGIPEEKAMQFGKDMSMYLGIEYNADHFRDLHKLGYLPIRIKALEEGIEVPIGIPHMTFVNTIKGFAWLTLYLETPISSTSWKMPTNATIALQFRRNAYEWVMKTDPSNAWFIDYACHDFSARGLDPFSALSSGLGHASSHIGSDSLIVIPGARYFYGEPENEVCIKSVNASEHSVSTTKIFTVGERQMIIDWLIEFPTGILSIVADTFDLWQLIEYLKEPEIKELILARNGKLVIRPDSGDPVDIICGHNSNPAKSESIERFEDLNPIGCEDGYRKFGSHQINRFAYKGVIELLWDIFGGTTNDEGFKILDSHIGAIYGDSINLDRQVTIYERLSNKGFAATTIVLGVGSYTYQFNTRDTFGFAAKGSWFSTSDGKEYSIYKDPITDDGTKKSLRGMIRVNEDFSITQECTKEQEKEGILRVIFEDGKYFNKTTLTEIRSKLSRVN